MNDLVSRQEVISVLNDGAELLRRVLDETYVVGDERTKYEWGISLIESYISEMNGLPSAEPEHKKGEWILPNNPIAVSLNEWICSKCHCLVEGKHNYCPNCGADMRGEQDVKVR